MSLEESLAYRLEGREIHLVYGLLLLSLLFWSCSFSYSLLAATTPKRKDKKKRWLEVESGGQESDSFSAVLSCPHSLSHCQPRTDSHGGWQ